MSIYRISGVWKNDNGVITDYSFHLVNIQANTFGALTKKTKAEAISMLESGNSATTVMWNYTRAGWNIGETVRVVGNGANKYLKSSPDNQLTDNLGHLINWNAIV